MINLTKCILAILLSVISTQIFGQPVQRVIDDLAGQINTYTDHSPQASIYLKTSKDIYESEEDVWFKALVLDAQYHTAFSLDKTLYVRLTKMENDSTVWEEKYLISMGFASGHLYLDKSLTEGNYLLSAYSAHSFYGKAQSYQALKMIKVVADVKAAAKTKATNPTLHPFENQNLQFTILPEGGRLVSGVMSTVAFKAVDNHGIPADIHGELLQGNRVLKTFRPFHAGMGSFKFKPLPGMTYQVRVSHLEESKVYPLPAIAERGVVMQLVKNLKDTIIFRIAQNPGSVQQTVYLRLQVRGRVQTVAAGTLRDSLMIKLPVTAALRGIAEVSLFDGELRPLAERLVYIKPNDLLYITAELSKESYRGRDKITLGIKAADTYGKPIQASLGINVYDKIYQDVSDAKNIITHYYLSSQLKGYIYNPGYYFDPKNANRYEALDMLLLTQGWRLYLWNQEEVKSIKPQKSLLTDSIKGQVVAANTKSKRKPQMLMAFSTDEKERRTILTDLSGNFAIAPEEFVKGRRSYLKRFDSDKNGVYTVKIDDPFDTIRTAVKGFQLNYPRATETAIKPETIEGVPADRLNQGAIRLKEVNVVAKSQNAFRDKYIGYLDSIAKLDGNTDFVSPNSNWLNVPVGAGGTKPVEGRKYTVWTGPNPPTSTPFSFGSGDFKEIIYHYPKFTEEELLKKFKLTRLKGYYDQRAFYQPNYDKESDSSPDYRNTLLWMPEVITDKDGKASISFFASDIASTFIGNIEGIDGNGLLGRTDFKFTVTK
jgi:hypothetical protein